MHLKKIAVAVALLYLVALLIPADVGAEWVEVEVTNYTCAHHPSNPMTNHPDMCKVTRWGNTDVMSRGAACLPEWRGLTVEVAGMVLECDDTVNTLYQYAGGVPRVDVRVPTWAEAKAWGSRRMEVYLWRGVTLPPQPEQPTPVQVSYPSKRPVAAHAS